MQRTLGSLIVVALGSLSCLALAGEAPGFEDCPAPVHAVHAEPSLKFLDAQGRRYRTAIRDAAKGPVDFAGHYVLATWGCGAECVMAAAIDKASGRVTSLPFSVSNWPLDVTEPLGWRADSCLLVVRGQRNEKGGTGPYYYRFDGKAFRPADPVR